MSALRAPVVAGVAGGVGTTTVAAALHGRDAERDVAHADIVVCHLTGDSLRRVARISEELAGPGPRPVLAVTAVPGGSPRGPLAARLRLLEPRFGGVVVLPRVGSWRELAEPLAEAAVLLGQPAERLSRTARGYADALRSLAAAVAASGRLALPAPQGATATPAAAPPTPDVARGSTSSQRPEGLRGPRSARTVPGPATPPTPATPAIRVRPVTPAVGAVAAAPAARPPRLWPGLTAVEHRPRALHPSVVLPDDVAIEEGRPEPPHPPNVVPLRRPVTAGLLAAGANR